MAQVAKSYKRALYYELRPNEKLYDLKNDPQELINLADDPQYRDELTRLRGELLEFMQLHNDGVPRLRTPD